MRRLEICKRNESLTETNELGQDLLEDVLIKAVQPIEIKDKTASLLYRQADTIVQKTSIIFIIRFKSFPGLSQDYFLKYNGKRFKIEYVNNLEQKNEYLEVYASEVS